MDRSKIQWTDATWNPIVGCNRVSHGCENCYAEVMAARLANAAQARAREEGLDALTPTQRAYREVVRFERGGRFPADLDDKALPRWNGQIRLVPEKLDQPLRWQKPRRIFVNSMSDLFHEGLADSEIAAVFGVMAAASRHTFQVLTKRPDRARRWFHWAAKDDDPASLMKVYADAVGVELGEEAWSDRTPTPWPLSNVELGTSVEDQKTADHRLPHLVECPAAWRFVSYEPALAAVDFERIEMLAPVDDGLTPGVWLNVLTGHVIGPDDQTDLKIHGVIVGGESGPAARVFHLEWVRSLIDPCRRAGVALFVKQLGRRIALPPGNPVDRLFDDPIKQQFRTIHCLGAEKGANEWQWFELCDSHGGDWDEWPEELQIRELQGAEA